MVTSNRSVFGRFSWRSGVKPLTFVAVAVFAAGLATAPLWADSAPRADGKHTPFTTYAVQSQSCPPIALISPGFGGTERGLGALAVTLQAAGYLTYVIGHGESGPRQLRQALRASDKRSAIFTAAGDPAALAARFLDIDAVWAAATATCTPTFAVFAGHSMGAQTVMMEAGAIARTGRMGKNRFNAYIALSPQGVGARFAAGAWDKIDKPVLLITGTRDNGVDGDYTTRLTAFDHLPNGNKRQAVITGATHMNLGGRGGGHQTTVVQDIVRNWLADLKSTPLPQPLPLDAVRFQQK